MNWLLLIEMRLYRLRRADDCCPFITCILMMAIPIQSQSRCIIAEVHDKYIAT